MGAEFRPRARVTGLRANGTSYVMSDEELQRVVPDAGGIELYRVCNAGLPFELPIGEAAGGALPAGNDFRVTLACFLPGESVGKSFAELHWHDTVDVQVVVSGEVVQRLDDGSELTMRAGDIVIETGTTHAWENRGEEPAIVAIIMYAGKRVGTAPPEERNAARVLDR
jgi:quercetin dioxygenase-like cupin family protein